MLAPDTRHYRRFQADFPLIALSELGQPPLSADGILSFSTPLLLPADQIASPLGGIATIGTVTPLEPYGGNAAGIAAFPSIIIDPPPIGGQQASAHVATMSLYSTPTMAGQGAGFSVNDVLTMQGGTFSTPATIKILSVDGNGAVLTFTRISAGGFTGSYSALPAMPASFSGGTGTGFQLTHCGWIVETIVLDAAGDGYASVPNAVCAGTISIYGATQQQILAVTLTGSGTPLLLGASGPAGSPVTFVGAQIDASGGAPVVLTSANYTIQANISRFRAKPSAQLGTSLLTLTSPTSDNFRLGISFMAFG